SSRIDKGNASAAAGEHQDIQGSRPRDEASVGRASARPPKSCPTRTILGRAQLLDLAPSFQRAPGQSFQPARSIAYPSRYASRCVLRFRYRRRMRLSLLVAVAGCAGAQSAPPLPPFDLRTFPDKLLAEAGLVAKAYTASPDDACVLYRIA